LKAITLWQPWASLIAVGAKKIETRSWATKYRGPLAIHASMKAVEKPLYIDPRLVRLLQEAGYKKPTDLPTGCILATCNLTECLEMTEENIVEVPELEKVFGDFEPGRYMWILEDVKKLDKPIPAKGKQRIWEIEGL